MRFTRRPHSISAYLVPPNDGLTRRQPPVWLIKAIIGQRVKLQPDSSMTVNAQDEEPLHAAIGDWVVYYPNGSLDVLTQEDLNADYEPA